MSREKQKKRGTGKALMTLLNILNGVLCGIQIASYMKASGLFKAGNLREAAVFALMMLGFFAAMLTQIILHEAGHVPGAEPDVAARGKQDKSKAPEPCRHRRAVPDGAARNDGRADAL